MAGLFAVVCLIVAFLIFLMYLILKKTVRIVNEQTKSETYPGENAPFTFKIKTTEANTTVKVESRWGVPADSTIEKGDTLTVEASQVSNEEAAGE